MQNAQVLAHIQRLAAQLQSALQTRGVIDRAVGIVMSRTGGTEGEAMARLRALSKSEPQQLEVVAGQIVEEAAGRTEAGHPGRLSPLAGAALPSSTPRGLRFLAPLKDSTEAIWDDGTSSGQGDGAHPRCRRERAK